MATVLRDANAPTLATPRPRGASDSGALNGTKPNGPRSDTGTILIHWATAIAMVASLFTGLRIAADSKSAVVSKFLAPILPQGEVWTVHFVAGLTLFFCLSAYVVYMGFGRLMERNALRRAAALRLPGSSVAARKARWGGVNVILHWAMYAIVLIMTATGVALYLGYGSWVVWVHSTCAIVILGYIFVHTFTHFMYGGLQQWLRLFRPATLVGARTGLRHPLALALAVGVPVVAGLAYADIASRDDLVMKRVVAAPDLVKLLDDPAWAAVRPVYVHTLQGANLGGTGESIVEVRTLRDDANAYFAFRWEDPSRSLRRVPMIKQAGGWHLTDPETSSADTVNFYEDKFAVLFSRSDSFGNGGSTHLGPKPLADKPAPLNGRGLHYTDGAYLDMWQWKSSRGGMLGAMENMHIGPPTEPTPNETAVKGRYQAGYWGDPGKSMYKYNFPFEQPGGYLGPITPERLPKDWQAVVKGMGHWDPSPDGNVDEGSKWWLFEKTETVPYSKELDDTIPVGTILPSVLIVGEYEGGRAGIKAQARWSDDHWTLVASRKLATGSKYDVDFTPGSRYYLWFSVFDHTQTRHTRHMRPVELSVE